MAQLADGRALVDATEQRVYRTTDNDERKKYYSGKKKAFMLKTEFVTGVVAEAKVSFEDTW